MFRMRVLKIIVFFAATGAMLMPTTQAIAMSNATFWSLIAQSKPAAPAAQDQQIQTLHTLLSSLSKEELIAFHTHYETYLDKAYHWDLWAAAYIIGGGCSDDGFAYFLDWLIAQGEEVYTAALQDPNRLIGVAVADASELAGFRDVMHRVFEDKYGAPMPAPQIVRHDIQGEPWEEEDVEARLPELAAWIDSINADARPSEHAAPPPQRKTDSFWRRLFGGQ